MTSAEARRARVAVALVFFTNGALFANVVPRFPEIRSDLGLTNAALGSAIAAFALGALVVGPFAATLIQRLGSARVATFGIVGLAIVLSLIGVVSTWAGLAAVMFAAGAIDSLTDVGQNAHGLRVQRIYGRSIVNSFHGVWSIGAVTGGLMSAGMIALDVSLETALVVSSVVFAGVALLCRPFLLRGPDTRSSATQGRVKISRSTLWALAALGALAACGAVVEDAGSSWAALYLRDELDTGAAVAALAYVTLLAAMTVGRLVGDRFVDRLGQRTVVRAGGAATAIAMGLALAYPTLVGTLVAFAIVGLGVATLVPAAMHTGDELPGLPAGVGLTAVSLMLRVGFLASPPAVGTVSDATSLRVGLLGVVLAGTLVVFLSGVLLQHNPSSPSPPPVGIDD